MQSIVFYFSHISPKQFCQQIEGARSAGRFGNETHRLALRFTRRYVIASGSFFRFALGVLRALCEKHEWKLLSPAVLFTLAHFRFSTKSPETIKCWHEVYEVTYYLRLFGKLRSVPPSKILRYFSFVQFSRSQANHFERQKLTRCNGFINKSV